MKKGVFSSEDLGPADLDESRKFKLWHDLYQANFGSRDFMRAPDRKFRARFEFAQFGLIGLGAFDSTINYAARTAHDVRVDRKDAYFFLLNAGLPLMVRQRGHETVIAPGQAAVVTFNEPAAFCGHGESLWFSATVPHRSLRELVNNVDDLLARPLDASKEAVRHLGQYARMLMTSNGVGDDAAVAGHVGKALLELIALSLGAARDPAESVGMSGLRAARAREIVAEIRSGFSDPGFSPARVAGNFESRNAMFRTCWRKLEGPSVSASGRRDCKNREPCLPASHMTS